MLLMHAPTQPQRPPIPLQIIRAVLVVWYDINCKFAIYFLRWVARFEQLQSKLASLPGGRPLFPLPCFHRYSHR